MTGADAAGTRTIRVLLIGNHPAAGAPDGDVRELAERMPEARAVATGASTRGSPGIRSVRRHARLSPLMLLRLTWRIREQATRAEIIDVRVPLYVVPALILGILRRKPVVVRHHDSTAIGGQPRGLDRTISTRVREAVNRFVYRRASLVVAHTGLAQRTLIERYGVSPWRVRAQPTLGPVAPCDTAARLAARVRLGLPADAFVVCHVDAPVARSEADLLFAAWSQLIGAAGGAVAPPMRLLLASAGDARRGLAASRLTPDLEDSTTVLGRLGEDQIADVLRAVDLNLALSSEGRAGNRR